jgi:hypothetical protein
LTSPVLHTAHLAIFIYIPTICSKVTNFSAPLIGFSTFEMILSHKFSST